MTHSGDFICDLDLPWKDYAYIAQRGLNNYKTFEESFESVIQDALRDLVKDGS